MKTIHTDTYGILPWAWLAIGGFWLFSASMRSEGWWMVFDAIAGLLGLSLSLQEFRRRSRVRKQGDNPAIIRVDEHD